MRCFHGNLDIKSWWKKNKQKTKTWASCVCTGSKDSSHFTCCVPRSENSRPPEVTDLVRWWPWLCLVLQYDPWPMEQHSRMDIKLLKARASLPWNQNGPWEFHSQRGWPILSILKQTLWKMENLNKKINEIGSFYYCCYYSILPWYS